jgi:TonB family protein
MDFLIWYLGKSSFGDMSRRMIRLLLIVISLASASLMLAQNVAPEAHDRTASVTNSPICGDTGVVIDEIADKNELDLVQQQVVKPLMKRVYQTWLAHMPKEAAPPTSAQGVVRVTFTLLADGSVREVVITEPSALASLNEAAQIAILDSHHEVIGRRPLGTPANPDMFPAEVHRSSLHVRVQFLYNTHCVAE